ncbi:butyryl-CoA dehydrogenase [Roseateles sp. YR242]|uniref:acyl-CoA dehydrogenase family protein n=1 Tax=Roseateles sp. YR242 TaxID=1855305 RepID=UPI0008D355E3|nr:acyl-CoA dehydrogenase family protein [Roseateles sp. YR242]SEL23130.1 butyryl-CoA dehydrogenase [Roseateles sp. YR242]
MTDTFGTAAAPTAPSASAFALDETQAMLRDSLSRFLSDHFDIETRAKLLAKAHHEPPLWRAFSQQLGLLGAGFSESQGGYGGDLRDQLIVLETLGRHLAAEPYLGSVVLAGRVLEQADGPLARDLLGRLIEGDALPVVALTEPDSRHAWDEVRSTLHADGPDRWRLNGRKAVVHGAPWASDVLVLARSTTGGASGASAGPGGHRLSLVAVPMDAAGLTRRDYQTVDGAWASELALENVEVWTEQLLGRPGDADALLAPAVDAATLGLCAEACGLLSRLLADSVDYARDRRQFGQPIAGFQVIQHRLADMYIALEQLRAVTAWAADEIADTTHVSGRANLAIGAAPAAVRERAVSAAKVCAARACRLIGQGAVQIHGGMGMTEELAVGHFFRRATLLEQRFGSVGHHLRRYAALMAD